MRTTAVPAHEAWMRLYWPMTSRTRRRRRRTRRRDGVRDVMVLGLMWGWRRYVQAWKG